MTLLSRTLAHFIGLIIMLVGVWAYQFEHLVMAVICFAITIAIFMVYS